MEDPEPELLSNGLPPKIVIGYLIDLMGLKEVTITVEQLTAYIERQGENGGLMIHTGEKEFNIRLLNDADGRLMDTPVGKVQ